MIDPNAKEGGSSSLPDSPADRPEVGPGAGRIDHGICSHIGRRPENQDCGLAIAIGCRHLFAVADGMGGVPGGALASRLACERLKAAFIDEDKDELTPDMLSRRLVEAMFRADRYVRWQGRRRGPSVDMGSTLSGLLIAGTCSVIAHVGDSRIYRWRDGFLTGLTVDHTFVQDMISAGEVDPSNARQHPLRNVLTNVVGTAEALEFVDSRIDDLKAGDRFLLCTDGLTGVLNEDAIRETLQASSNANRTAMRLVGRALQNGARDNITAIVVEILQEYPNVTGNPNGIQP